MIPERYAPYVYPAFRFVVGFLFLLHGLQKLLGMFGGIDGKGGAVSFGVGQDLFFAAGVIETTCGALVMIGLFGPYAAFVASGMMAFAYFYVHQPQGGLPVQNGGEPAVLFCFSFLYIAVRGSGLLSVDALINRSASGRVAHV